MRAVWHILGRWCEARAAVARRRWLDMFDRELALKARAEEFFRRRDGS